MPTAASNSTRRELVTIATAAQRLSCSDKTVRRMIAAGRLTAYRYGSRMIRVDLADLEAAGRLIPTAGDVA